MSSWTGLARSNYFLVNDKAAFLLALAPYEETVSVIEDKSVMARGFCLLSLVPAGWHQDGTLLHTLAAHLADGQVAILIETGFRRRSYGAGHAVAINNRAETREVDLADIYKLAKELGQHVSPCEY